MTSQSRQSENATFDVKTAKPFKARIGGSPHHVYQDASGAALLYCEGNSPGGGVAVNKNGLEAFEAVPGDNKYVRVKNGKFDKTVPLEKLPKKPYRPGKY